MGVDYRHFNGRGRNLDGGEPVANLPNAPTIKEERQTHYHCEPEGKGRLNHYRRH